MNSIVLHFTYLYNKKDTLSDVPVCNTALAEINKPWNCASS